MVQGPISGRALASVSSAVPSSVVSLDRLRNSALTRAPLPRPKRRRRVHCERWVLGMRMRSLLAIGLTAAPLTVIASQERPVLKSGDRVRIIAPSVSRAPFVGTLVTLRTDSLVVQDGANVWRLSLASLTRLDISQGLTSHAGRGAGIGLLVGAGVGAVIGSGCDLTVVPVSSEAGCIAVGVALVGGAGALLGAVIGSHTRTERWAAVPLDHLRVSFMPRRSGRVQFTASISL